MVQPSKNESAASRVDELSRLQLEIADLKRRLQAFQTGEKQLKNSARKYRLMAEKALEGFLAVENDRIRFFNHRILELTGFDKEQLRQRTFSQLFHPADRTRIDQFGCRQGSKEADSPMFRMRCRSAGFLWVELNCTPIVWEHRNAMLVAVMDRTDRLRASEMIKESEARYRTLFEHADDAIFFETDNREIVDVNHRACDMFGYSREELLAMKTSDLFPKAGLQSSIYFNPALALDTPTELEAKHRDGRRLPVEATISPLVSGRKTIFMSIVRDCTQRKQAEEDRVRQEKLEAILELTGAVCHELSQPMMAIYGYTELIGMRIPENDPLRAEIAKIGEQVDRLGKITAKLMRITRYKTRDYLEGKIIDLDGASD